MSLAGLGPKFVSRHVCLIIAWTGQQGPVLYNGAKDVNDEAHPPESEPAEAGRLMASSLPGWTVLEPACLHKENVHADICHTLPPDRTWHKVNDPKVDYSGGLGEGKFGPEPKLELSPPEGCLAEAGALRPQVCFCWTVPEPACWHKGNVRAVRLLKEPCLYWVISVSH